MATIHLEKFEWADTGFMTASFSLMRLKTSFNLNFLPNGIYGFFGNRFSTQINAI